MSKLLRSPATKNEYNDLRNVIDIKAEFFELALALHVGDDFLPEGMAVQKCIVILNAGQQHMMDCP